MSKRYRDILDEVETPATRHAARVALSHSPPASTGGGGVATLVRPTTTTAPGAGPTRTGPRPRRSHPGNGPSDDGEPLAFVWRDRRYAVIRVLGHWREEEGWWRRPDGEPIRIRQSDLWRVEATRGTIRTREQRGVYELSRRGGVWRLDRVWD